MSIGPDGTAYATAFGIRAAPNGMEFLNMLAAVSHDGGRTWSDAQAIAHTSGDKDSVTADPTRPGVAYLVWDSWDLPNNSAMLSTTRDGGKTWSAPIRVSVPGRGQAAIPSVAVAADGTVGVTYYDFPAQLEAKAVPTNYRLVSSTDQGKHFGQAVHIAGPSDLAVAPGAGTYDAFDGDYQGPAHP